MGVLPDQGLLYLYLDAHQLENQTKRERSQRSVPIRFLSMWSLTHVHLFLQLVEELAVGRLGRDAGGALG